MASLFGWLETWPETCWNMLKHVETAICWHMRRLPSKVHEGIDLRRRAHQVTLMDCIARMARAPISRHGKAPFFSMENQLEGWVTKCPLPLWCCFADAQDLTSKDRIDIQMWVEYEQNENQRCAALLVLTPEFIVSIPFLKRKNGSPTGMMICVYLCGQMWSM